MLFYWVPLRWVSFCLKSLCCMAFRESHSTECDSTIILLGGILLEVILFSVILMNTFFVPSCSAEWCSFEFHSVNIILLSIILLNTVLLSVSLLRVIHIKKFWESLSSKLFCSMLCFWVPFCKHCSAKCYSTEYCDSTAKCHYVTRNQLMVKPCETIWRMQWPLAVHVCSLHVYTSISLYLTLVTIIQGSSCLNYKKAMQPSYGHMNNRVPCTPSIQVPYLQHFIYFLTYEWAY